MLKRVLMRRAYNAGRYNLAREHARRLLSNPKEQALARSVMVRSYWNEQAFQELIDIASQWDDELARLAERWASQCPTGLETLRTVIHGTDNTQSQVCNVNKFFALIYSSIFHFSSILKILWSSSSLWK